MRHASADNEPVKSASVAVTAFFKICTHCERLSKKVRMGSGEIDVKSLGVCVCGFFCPVLVARVKVESRAVFLCSAALLSLSLTLFTRSLRFSLIISSFLLVMSDHLALSAVS